MASFDNSLVTGENDGTIRVYDNAAWRRRNLLSVHAALVAAVKLFHNSRLGVSIDTDSKAHIWDHVSGTSFGSITRKSADRSLTFLYDLAISGNARWLVTLSKQPSASLHEFSVRVCDLKGPD